MIDEAVSEVEPLLGTDAEQRLPPRRRRVLLLVQLAANGNEQIRQRERRSDEQKYADEERPGDQQSPSESNGAEDAEEVHVARAVSDHPPIASLSRSRVRPSQRQSLNEQPILTPM